MSKYYGKIGFSKTEDKGAGICEETIVEQYYYGDVIRNTKKWVTTADKLLDNIEISNELSIVADPFAFENFRTIKYAEYMNALWKVTSAEVIFPRIRLTLGGVYNGPQA